jgi:hypothetical protein
MREEFCTAVKILLQRMETHPEEFYEEMVPNRIPNNPKWGHIIGQIVSLKHGGDMRGDATFLTGVEQDALYDSYVKLRRKALDDYVMREVLTPEEDEGVERTVTFKTKNRYSIPQAEGVLGPVANSVVPDAYVYSSVAQAQAARSIMLQQIQARQQGLRGNSPTTMYIDEVYDPLTAGIK